MKIYLTFLFIITSSYIFGQRNNAEKEIIEFAINYKSTERITYIDQSVGWEIISKHINNNRKFKGYSTYQQNSLELSQKEYNQIIEHIEKYKKKSFENSLFRNSDRIVLDSMWSYLQNERQIIQKERKKAIQNNDTEKIRLLKYKYPWVYGFSKPIFIRDGEYCLFYYFKMCGNPCGNNELAFYKKDNNKWIKWIVLRKGEY